MPGIVEPPRVVQDAVNEFGDLFGCEPARRRPATHAIRLWPRRDLLDAAIAKAVSPPLRPRLSTTASRKA